MKDEYYTLYEVVWAGIVLPSVSSLSQP